MTIQAALLPDGRRLHLQHGPIDLVIEAWGEVGEVRAAYGQAMTCFRTVLNHLVEELPLLRQPLGETPPALTGSVARNMLAACWPYRDSFITPMAAVAGGVADHVLAAMLTGRQLAKAYVNDGGDIALHLAARESFDCGVVAHPAMPALLGKIHLVPGMGIGGIATSGAPTKGQGGRSFSFGIADAVTVLARTAASADAAATMIANAVDLSDHAGIRRVPASSLDPDSDLGDRLVTLAVPRLATDDVARALADGARMAENFRQQGLISAAILALQEKVEICGADPLLRLAA
ncbi:MAG: UPF0280 family protein [Dongiaceae bacterium]